MITQKEPFETTDYGNGHVVRYYMIDGDVKVEETMNGRTLVSTLYEFLTGDLVERAKYFIPAFDHHSSLASGPTNLGSP